MKKTIITIIILIGSLSALSAQERNRSYYGLLELAGGYSFNHDKNINIQKLEIKNEGLLNLSYVNGYRFSSHFAMGIGVGLNYYFNYKQASLPVFLHFNYDILKWKITPYIALNIGNNFQISEGKFHKNIKEPELIRPEDFLDKGPIGKYNYRGIYAEPTLGLRFKCCNKSLNAGISYVFDRIMDRTTDAYSQFFPPQLRLKVGIEF